MAENVAPTQGNGDVPGQPFYEQSRLELRKMLKRQALLQAQLAQQEEMIYKKETEYLEDTPAGNIIVGFDSYTKGTASTAAGGARRKAQVSDSSRLFSRSSITWNADSPGLESAQSTPMAAMAPTPMSTSFQKGDSVSNHATPTSASSANRLSAAGGASAAGKKNKKPTDEDDDDERRDVKKARSVSGAVARK